MLKTKKSILILLLHSQKQKIVANEKQPTKINDIDFQYFESQSSHAEEINR